MRRGAMSSVNIAGSRRAAPYTGEDDFTTRCRSRGAFWQAASSCMVPMTLISFIVTGRRPAGGGDHAEVDDGVDVLRGDDLGDHRVADVGADEATRRRGRRAAGRRRRRSRGRCRGSAARQRAKRPPRSRETPVTSTTRPMAAPSATRGGAYLPSLRRWTRVFFSSLRCFFFAIRLRRFLMTEPTRKPFTCNRSPQVRSVGPRQPIRRRRAAESAPPGTAVGRARARRSAGVEEATCAGTR